MRTRFIAAYLLVFALSLLASTIGRGQTVPPNIYLPIAERNDMTATPTVEPTATSTPLPTPTRGNINCVSGQVTIPDTQGFYLQDSRVFGEICNGTSRFLRNVRVVINAYDEAGNLSATWFHTYDYDLYPDKRYCFWSSSEVPNAAFYSLSLDRYARVNDAHPNLEMSALTQDRFQVSATITNQSDVTAQIVRFVAGIYGGDGKLTGCGTVPYSNLLPDASIYMAVGIQPGQDVFFFRAAVAGRQ